MKIFKLKIKLKNKKIFSKKIKIKNKYNSKLNKMKLNQMNKKYFK